MKRVGLDCFGAFSFRLVAMLLTTIADTVLKYNLYFIPEVVTVDVQLK
jgi:hypothetical protein